MMNNNARSPISIDVLDDILVIQNKLGWDKCMLEVGVDDYVELKAVTYIGNKDEFIIERWLRENGVTLTRGNYKRGIALRPI